MNRAGEVGINKRWSDNVGTLGESLALYRAQTQEPVEDFKQRNNKVCFTFKKYHSGC